MKLQKKIKYAVFKIDEGWCAVCATKKGISFFTLPRASKEEAMDAIKKHTVDLEIEEAPDSFERIKKDIVNYFSGKKIEFESSIDLSKYTPFQSAVFTAARSIPYGETRSYRWIAKKIGNPKGVRAVGQALKLNKIPLIIPCHRIIEENGRLGGFSFGIKWKERLLQLEGAILA